MRRVNLKIYYVHSAQINSKTPSISFILNRIKGFEKNKIDVEVVLRGEENTDLKAILSEKYNFKSKLNYVKVKLIDSKNQRNFYKKAVDLIKSNNVKDKVILTRTIGFLPYLIRLKKKFGHKVYYETHDFFYDLKLRNDIVKHKKVRQFILERLYLKKVDGLVCVSKKQKEIYKKHLNVPIKTIPCGMDNKIIECKDEKEKVFAYIGSLEKRKGIENIVALVKMLPKEYRVLIIGGKNQEELENFSRKLKEEKIFDRVEITGWLTKYEIHKRLKRVKIGVVPLTDNFFNRYLTSPLKIYDFMSCKIPVIASDLPSVLDFIEDGKNGYIFNWKEKDKVLKIIEKLENEREYNKLVKGTVETVNRYDNKDKSAELVDFLRS